jgi:hypothetical protein
MATNIVGTFPILNRQKSQIDEYGFDYITYEYTLKTETVDQYTPQKDDVFNGVLSQSYVNFGKTPALEYLYVVENVQVTPMNGGLSTLTVQTVGTKNSPETATPKVFIRQGGPLIFGLLGGRGFEGRGAISGVGQEIEVKFMEFGGSAGENDVYQKYFTKVMPSSFRGIKLPTPASQPGFFDYTTNQSVENQVGYKIGTEVTYYGFVCKRVLTERRGSLLLVSIFFSEAGRALVWDIVQGQNTATSLYNYSIWG